MQLLQEKEQELEALRAAAPPQEPDSDALSVALRRAAPSEPSLLLYAEQLARKEAEAGALRREKHRLQDELHRLLLREPILAFYEISPSLEQSLILPRSGNLF